VLELSCPQTNEGGVMALWEMINTEVQLAGPLNNSLEATFGQVALKLLEKDDRASLEELMKLYKQAGDIMSKVDRLVNKKKKA